MSLDLMDYTRRKDYEIRLFIEQVRMPVKNKQKVILQPLGSRYIAQNDLNKQE
jgi:hypothetical protein